MASNKHNPHQDRSPNLGSHWFTAHPESAPVPREQTISETRAVEEAMTRLNPDAAPEELRDYLEKVGIWLDLAEIERIRSSLHGGNANDLVKTQAEPVPPPEQAAHGKSSRNAAAGSKPPAPNPAELVKTEAERVPPPERKR